MPSQTSPTQELLPNGGHYFDDDFIQQVREGVLEQCELVDNNNDEVVYRKDLIYDRKDVEQLKVDDWFIRRFLKWEPTTLNAAVKCMHQALLWRKRIEINSWYVLKIIILVIFYHFTKLKKFVKQI